MTARRIQPQADGLAPGRPDIGEDAGEPDVGADVDRVLVTSAAEGDVGNPAGQVMTIGPG